jgi:hypothetical protein
LPREFYHVICACASARRTFKQTLREHLHEQ